jgi:predicted Zn-dependent protease with MMP-like domain
MKHIAKIQADFLKVAVDARHFLQKALERNDKRAIDYWLKVLAKKSREQYPVVNLTEKEFEELKKRPNDNVEVDRVKTDAIRKFDGLGIQWPVKDIKSLQELTDKDKSKVLAHHGSIPKYAFTVNGTIYLNVKAIQDDKQYTDGLEHVVYHELGHHIFHSKHNRQIIMIMNKYGLDDDHDEDFAELVSYKMTGKLTDKSLKMYKIWNETRHLIGGK